jgi:Sel1 repeat
MVAALAGESSAPPPEPLPNPIAEPGRWWAFDGFALKPPGAGEWYSLVKSRDRAVFARAVSPTYALIAVAHAARVDDPPATPEELAQFVRRRVPRSPDAIRYEIKEQRVELEPAASWCVRYRTLAEDSRASFFYPRIVRIAGRICAHPAARGLLVDVSCAEQAVEGESQPESFAECEGFLAGVRLLPLHGSEISDADELISDGAALKAVTLLAPLAEQGFPRAALLLAAAYEEGRGVSADPAEADRWYRIAAEAGEVDALYNLGAHYDHAPNGARNPQEALRWFRRAADQRDSQAQLNIGLFYLKGDGVAKDATQAHYWLRLSAANGNARARALLQQLFR